LRKKLGKDYIRVYFGQIIKRDWVQVMACTDNILSRTTDYFEQKGMSVKVNRVNKGYTIIHETGQRIARLLPAGDNSDEVEVLWWSHRNKWEHIGDFDGLFMKFEEALEYVLSDPMDIFWMGLS
jgi:hypothetical protein